MTSVILGDTALTDISNRHCSSIFGSARTHQSIEQKVSNCSSPPVAYSSEDTQPEQCHIGDSTHGRAKDPLLCENDPSRYSPVSTFCLENKSPDKLMDASELNILGDKEEEFSTAIRPHGAPLDTITERSSIATIQEPFHLPNIASFNTIRELRNIDRKSSAPDSAVLRKWHHEERRLTQSLDEAVLETQRPSLILHAICETAEGNERYSDVGPPMTSPVLQQPLAQQIGDLPTSRISATTTASRRTSAYVRDIYNKLIGGNELGQLPASKRSPSKIPVSTSVIRRSQVGQAHRRPLETEPKRKMIHGVSHDTQGDSTKIRTENQKLCSPGSQATSSSKTQSPEIVQLCEQEEVDSYPLRTTPRRFSNILAKTSRLFDSPKLRAPKNTNNGSQTISNDGSDPITAVPGIVSSQHDPDRPNTSLPASTVPLTSPKHEPPSDIDTDFALPLSVVLNRSIFDIQATETPIRKRILSKESGSPSQAATVLAVRNGMPISPVSQISKSGTPSSWDLPLDPFPLPPSPNHFATPPSWRTCRDDPAKDRFTNDGVCVSPPSVRSFSSLDRAVDAPAAESITASNSSTSLVAGQSLSQRTPGRFFNDSDPFISIDKRLNVDGAISNANSPYGHTTPSLPIHMPSPLRPRARLQSRYSLFPSEATSNLSTKSRVKSHGIRNFRSLSSMLRVPSATMRASKSSDLEQQPTEKICPHGRPVERINIFSGRKLSSTAWRLRHWVRDGGTSCFKCRVKRIRAGLVTAASCGLFGNGWKTDKATGTTRRSKVSTRNSAAHGSTPQLHAEEEDQSPLVVRHPLEDIEDQRMSLEKAHSCPALGSRVRSLGSKWATWAPSRCFCQVVDDGTSVGGTSGRRESSAVRVARVRRVID